MDEIDLRMFELSQKGYYCSQILLSLALETQGKEDPDLIRAMAGLARGAGADAGTCGTLTGAACLLALYAGKGQDQEEEREELWPMLHQLWEWFEDEVASRYGGSSCGEILQDGTPARQRCGPIIARTYAKAMQILVDNGFDPSEPRGG
jgi:Putative redox-active protein (C_GCAxxG_C_C)